MTKAAVEALNAKGFKATPPPILTWEGQQPWQEPRLEVRYFHRKKIDVWSGYVRTADVKGWVENVRIELFVDKWKKDHKGELPNNDEILDWMVRDQEDEFKLEELAQSIAKNGVRHPIVITSNGDLLDGNRRYFSALMMQREAEKKGDIAILPLVNHLPAYVLSPSCDKADFESVLVEENFVPSCREEWPNFIKARKVYDTYQDLREAGLTKRDCYAELMERFGGTRGRVEYYIKTMSAIQEFEDYHTEEDEQTGRAPKDPSQVKWKAQRYFDHFAELSKAQVQKALEADPEFRAKVFDRLFDGDFVNYNQVRKLPAIAADRVARGKFMTLIGQQALEGAIDWVTITGVAKKAVDNNERIASFKRFLENLGAKEIADLDSVIVAELETILQKVVQMAKAVHQRRK